MLEQGKVVEPKTIIEEGVKQDKYSDIEVEDAFDSMVDSEIKPPPEEFIAPDSQDEDPDTDEPKKKDEKKETTPADEAKEDEKKDEAEPGKEKPKEEKYGKRVQKRIDKLTYDVKSADERADAAEAEIAKLKEGKDVAEPAPEPVEMTEEAKKAAADRAKLVEKQIHDAAIKQVGEKPIEGDFDNLDDYTIALAGWSADVKHYEHKARETLGEKQKAVREKALDFGKRMDKGFDLYDDFEEVAFNPTLGITRAMVAAMQDIEEVPELTYYLGKNPKVCTKIARMEPISMAVELGKIVARFVADPKSKPKETTHKSKTVTDAPEPIETVNSSIVGKFDPIKASHADYRKWREDGGGT